MLKSFCKLSSRGLGGPIQSFVFFALFYLYLWLIIEPRLIYHGGGIISNFPVFLRGWMFFCEFLFYPGGLVEYISAFLSQFFYYSWTGAFVVTLQAWLICTCFDYFFKAVDAPHFRWLSFVPALLLLVVYNQYTYHFTTTMALLIAMAFVCLYLKINPKNELPGLAVFLVMSVVLYYLVAGAYLLFALLCAIYELLLAPKKLHDAGPFRHRWRLGLVYLLSALLIPYIMGVLIFGASIVNAFGDLLPLSPEVLSFVFHKRMVTVVYILYLLGPVMALILGLWRLFLKAGSRIRPIDKSSKPAAGTLKWTISFLVLVVLAAGTALFSHNKGLKVVLEVDYHTYHKQWSKALAAARRYPGSSFYVVHSANMALHYTGRLGSDMFLFPQHINTLLLTDKDYAKIYWQKADAYLELGFINRAEHELVETLEIFGEHPVVLKRLVFINMVKGNLGAARIYLNALGKTLFDTDWADNHLNKLESDPDLSTDKEVQRLRGLMMENDYGYTSLDGEKMLSDLLAKNKQNRMAFEYLMSSFLLTIQLDKLVQNIYRLDDFDYPQIPRLYEEAILIYEYLERKTVDLRGRRISLQSRQRFDSFNQIYLGRYRQNKQAAFNELAENYGNTYFFYYLYGLSGLKK